MQAKNSTNFTIFLFYHSWTNKTKQKAVYLTIYPLDRSLVDHRECLYVTLIFSVFSDYHKLRNTFYHFYFRWMAVRKKCLFFLTRETWHVWSNLMGLLLMLFLDPEKAAFWQLLDPEIAIKRLFMSQKTYIRFKFDHDLLLNLIFHNFSVK